MSKRNTDNAPVVSETKAFLLTLWAKRRSPMGDLTRALCCFVIGILIGIAIIGQVSDFMGIMKGTASHEVTIEPGWATVQVGYALEKAGIIRHPLIFSLYSGTSGASSSFKSGTYMLDSGMTYKKIISVIQRQQSGETVRLTFTEGMTVTDIADLLDQKGVCVKSEFLAAINKDTFNYDFLPQATTGTGRFYRLEGYLFPDTYDFYLNENPDSVIKKFLDNFNEKLTPDMRSEAAAMHLSIDQLVTLSSIIEKEAPDVFAKADVSSVLHNRLNNAGRYPKLQSDATAYYVNNIIYKALKIADPIYNNSYNTYVCEGLPVGAICNPGSASLIAALNPTQTNYFYFVTDSKGNFYYATTLAQQNANIKKASASGAIGGTNTHD